MKRNFILGMTLQALVLTMSISTFAQADNNENQALIEVVNDPAPAATVQSAPAQASVVQAAPAAAPAVVDVKRENQFVLQNQPVINQQQPNIYVQKQSATVVEDSPLVESAADKMRKQRVEMEQQTESKIVEKLEEARMKAEQERATKLLSGLEEKKEEKKAEEPVAAPVPVVVAPQPVQVVEPAPVQEVAPAIEVKSELSKLDEKPEENKKYYITLDTGFVAYSADNIDTGVGVGTNFGAIFDDRFVVEGNFLFTRANIESVTQPVAFTPSGIYPTIIQMDQYGVGGTFKFRILKTRISPYVGGSVAYTYRNYKNEQSPYGYVSCPYYNCDLDASSWAVDMGLLAGADIALSDNFSVGSEFKYMFNVVYDVKTNGLQQSKLLYPDFYNQPVEELGYYSLAISLKYMF